MDDAIRDEIRRRLLAGENATKIARATGVARWQVEHQRSYVRTGVSLELEIGDRVWCRDDKYAWVRTVLDGGAILTRDGRWWYACTAEYIYCPDPDAVCERAAKLKAAGLDATRDSEIQSPENYAHHSRKAGRPQAHPRRRVVHSNGNGKA